MQAARSKAHDHVCYDLAFIMMLLRLSASAVHEVSHDLLFTAKLIRLGGKPIQVVWRWGRFSGPGTIRPNAQALK